MSKKLWWTSSSGQIELQMTLSQAESVSHPGQCDLDVRALIPELKNQLDKISPELLAKELKEYGAWDEKELSNHADNIERLVWIAGGDISEKNVSEAM